MELSSGSTSQYPKFLKIGDSAEGRFVAFKEAVPSKFGTEDQLILQGANGRLVIRCTTSLGKTIRENLKMLEDKRPSLKITFTSTVPSTKGAPTKLYTVTADEIEAPSAPAPQAPSAPAANPNGTISDAEFTGVYGKKK